MRLMRCGKSLGFDKNLSSTSLSENFDPHVPLRSIGLGCVLCLFCFLVVFGDLGPVDDVPKGLDVIWPAILVVEVVSVFPDVEAEYWSGAGL